MRYLIMEDMFSNDLKRTKPKSKSKEKDIREKY